MATTEPVPVASFSIQTPAAPGAIGVIALHSPELDTTLEQLGLRCVRVGQVVLRDLLGVDRGLVVRWSESRADLMPHAGVGVMRQMRDALVKRGFAQRGLDPRVAYPEAESRIEARMLAALAVAPSERAIDLLLAQPARWEGVAQGAPPESFVPPDHLRFLLEPALVVIAGRPNIGKSTLVNALAGRGVSVVADEAGTTRDHVGVMLELDALVVRCLDLPGLEAGAGEVGARAQRLAMDVARGADLTLLCGDAAHEPPEPGAIGHTESPALRLALRGDLGTPAWAPDLVVCAPERTGIDQLARLIRRRLVPDAALNDPRPWRFWSDEDR